MKLVLHILIAFNLFASFCFADDISVAVAANFTEPMKKISALFMKETAHKLNISYGSSGKFYAQIKNNAPFAVFLSADQEHIKKLVQENLALSETEFTYAVGKLALWSTDKNLIDHNGEVLKKAQFRHLAIANPKLAPYGVAAKEVIEKEGLWQKLKPKLVLGENISQTFQFTAAGNAELGFVALSQVKNLKQANSADYWVIPQKLYTPIRQDAVLLRKAKDSTVAKELLAFLKNKEVKKIITDYGYGF